MPYCTYSIAYLWWLFDGVSSSVTMSDLEEHGWVKKSFQHVFTDQNKPLFSTMTDMFLSNIFRGHQEGKAVHSDMR